MRRRREQPGAFNIWPAFTDVLGGLVVVLVFLITMFVIGEVLIGREVTSKDTVIGQLSSIVQYMEDLIGASEEERRRLERRVGELESQLSARENALGTLRGELAEVQQERDRFEQRLVETRGDARRLREDLTARDQAYQRLAESKAWTDRVSLEARDDVARLRERITRLTAELERLNRALYGTREDLAQSQAALAARKQALAAAEQRTEALETELDEKNAELQRRATTIAAQGSRIQELDRLIKRRLVERVEELEKYKSDFFGRLRDVFADNPDIKIVGDRFVFQSEVLFPSGEAELSPGGRQGLDKFVEVYRQIEPEIPEDLPVLIEVQGHTDRVPIRTARFSSNWELSAHRALNVVSYLIEQGIPPERLAAVGMGEYHPIDPADTPEAYRKNRRIELKITSR